MDAIYPILQHAYVVNDIDEAMRRWKRVDILHNNVGVSLAGGDANPLDCAHGRVAGTLLLAPTRPPHIQSVKLERKTP